MVGSDGGLGGTGQLCWGHFELLGPQGAGEAWRD